MGKFVSGKGVATKARNVDCIRRRAPVTKRTCHLMWRDHISIKILTIMAMGVVEEEISVFEVTRSLMTMRIQTMTNK